MSDSGKHSALRQTSDGSFEIVFDRSGLQEISEDEVGLHESSVPEARLPIEPASSRVIVFSVAGVVALLLVGAIGWVALSPGTTAKTGADEVPGFRPYGGTGELPSDGPDPAVRGKRAAAAAALAEIEAEPAEEITESEPGWELTEAVEPPVMQPEQAQPEQIEPPPGVVPELIEPEVAEAEVADVEEDAEVDVNEADERVRSFGARRALNSMRGADIGRNLQPPRVPTFNANPLAAQRLNSLPIRTLQTNTTGDGATAEQEEIDDDIDIDGEVEGE